MGDCLLWAAFENYRRSVIFWATFFRGTSYVLIWTKKLAGNILDDFFHNLIWSPCKQSALNTDWEKSFLKALLKAQRMGAMVRLKIDGLNGIGSNTTVRRGMAVSLKEKIFFFVTDQTPRPFYA
jgi:hypothetical protein